MSKAIVLLSGGQDSATCLHWALTMFDEVEAVCMHYGQRHQVEIMASKAIAEAAGVRWTLCDVPYLKAMGNSALVDGSELRGSGGYVDEAMPEGLPTSFVPGRNLLFLSIASAYAVSRGARNVVTGVCQTDYSGYPDCREAFVQALEKAVTLAMPSSAGPIRLHTPLMHMTKAETVKLALRLGDECMNALGKSITCYEGATPGCGECGACELREIGFSEVGIVDPARAAA